MPDLSRYNTVENRILHNRINSHSKDTTVFQPNVFQSALHRLLIINT